MSIQEHLNKIRNAIKGSEVRESIAKGIETAYDDASEKDNANMEVKIARGTNPNLNTRLNKMDETDRQNAEKIDGNHNEVTAQLAQKANKTELNAVSSQVDNLVAHAGDTDNNSELLDIRVDAFGANHSTAGRSVRHQINKAVKGTSGVVVESNLEVELKYNTFKDGELLFLGEGARGLLDELPTSILEGASNYIIDVSTIRKISYPVFKTTNHYGSVLIDKNNQIIFGHAETTLETGSMKTIDVPPNADKLILSISSSLSNIEWHIEYPTNLEERIKKLEEPFISLEKNDILTIYSKEFENQLLDATNSMGLPINDVVKDLTAKAYSIKFDVRPYVAIEYPVFKSSSIYGSLILDENEVVIWQHVEKNKETGSLKRIDLPKDATTFVLNISQSLNGKNFKVNLYTDYTKDTIKEILEFVHVFDSEEEDKKPEANDLALCALDTAIKDYNMPFHKGYLFHSLNDNNQNLYYGRNFKDIKKIGEVAFNTNDSMLAISPSDNRVIATRRGQKGSLHVWDGETTHSLFNDITGPKGWLYNSGVEFTLDSEGNEICLFAEYAGDISGQTGGFYVWRGTFPYTSENDWDKVFYQRFIYDVGAQEDVVTHFHQIRRDPWTDILYLTSGDEDEATKWWYSDDYGLTWNLLGRGTTTGWESHSMRCINFIFTEDYVYWAVDYGENHTLNRIKRNSETGILDLNTREILTDLPEGQATNSIAYSHYPEGIFMYDRWDYGTQFEEYYDLPIHVQFWDIQREELVKITEVKNRSSTWGGHRGQTYINYTNPYNPYPAIGFSDDTRNPFEVPVTGPSQVGTIYYDILEGSMNFLS